MIRLAIFFGILTFLVTVVGGGYVYYKNTQSQLAILNQQVATFSLAVEEQRQTIAALESSIQLQQEIRSETAAEIKAARQDLEKLQSTINKHNFKAIAEKKPTLFERRINNATKEVLRCFEVVTGDAVKQNEKNNQCSYLFTVP